MSAQPHDSAAWRLLERAVLGIVADHERAELASLVRRRDLDWGEVIAQALRHKILPLVAHALQSSQCYDAVPGLIAMHFRQALLLGAHRARRYRELALDICEALGARDVRVACTKGIVLESTVYDGCGDRQLGDIDFMIHGRDGAAVSVAMQGLGFVNGYLERRTGTIKKHSRRDLIAQRLNPDHLPAFVRETDDPLMPHLHVDFATSLTWARSSYRVPLELALAETDRIAVPGYAGATLPALTTPYHFVFTVLHLFREAWVPAWIELEQDVNLMKFGDVLRLWRRHREELEGSAFRDLLSSLGVAEPVAWVLVHLDRTFGTGIASALGLEDAVSEELLCSAAGDESVMRTWHGNMRARLMTWDRRGLYSNTRGGSSSAPPGAPAGKDLASSEKAPTK